MASVFPTTLVLAGERMRITGAMTGWFLVGGGAGGMILPWVIGQAFVGIGAGAMPVLVFITIVANLLSLVTFIYLRPKTVKNPRIPRELI
jgi:nitrate/nitrite transporter NarK